MVIRGWQLVHTTTILVFSAFLLVVAAPLACQTGASPAHRKMLNLRDRQDLAGLGEVAGESEARASKSQDQAALYSAALARSYQAEVALELGKKPEAAAAAESGIRAARNLVERNPSVAEYHRVLGTLCGQIIPANLMSALQYGNCARAEIETAIRLDPRSAWAYLGRGVGNYYLPETFGGGVDKAVTDFRQASALQPSLPDAWLWLGLALRKKGDRTGARKALIKAQALAPDRVWIGLQLEKTR